MVDCICGHVHAAHGYDDESGVGPCMATVFISDRVFGYHEYDHKIEYIYPSACPVYTAPVRMEEG